MNVQSRFVAPVTALLAMLRRDQQTDIDIEDSLPVDTVYVATTDNLPVDGEADIKYHVVADASIWRWADGAYHEVNPYVYGVDQIYRDMPRVIRPKATIVDPSAEMASLSLDQVRRGSSETLATLYNLHALRADLDMFRRLVVTGHQMTVMDLLGKGPSNDRDRNVTEWFAREHKAMYNLLRASSRSKGAMHNPVCDALHKQKASLTWDEDLNQAVFKIDDFKVYL